MEWQYQPESEGNRIRKCGLNFSVLGKCIFGLLWTRQLQKISLPTEQLPAFEGKPALKGSDSESSMCCHYIRSEVRAMICTKFNKHLSTNYTKSNRWRQHRRAYIRISRIMWCSVWTQVYCKSLATAHVCIWWPHRRRGIYIQHDEIYLHQHLRFARI